MPTLISEEDVYLDPSDMLRRIPLNRLVDPSTGYIVPAPRTPGLHLSGLLKYIAQMSKIDTRIEQVHEEEHPMRWALGQAFEEYAVSLMPHVTWQPGEASDPVIMTCDGLTLDGAGPPRVIEYKCNRSKKQDGAYLIQRKWLFMCQGMGYLIGYSAALGYEIDVVEWNVLWVLDWPNPVWTKYLIRFDREDLNGMRRMIEANREGAIRNGYVE